jgi:hypothetical protein
MKNPQKFVTYLLAGSCSSFMLLIPSQVNSQINTKSNGYIENNKVMNNHLDYQIKDVSINLSNNIIGNKDYKKVTQRNSECARALLKALRQYMNVSGISASWSYGQDDYIYEEGKKSNNKSLQNGDKSVKHKVFSPYNLLASSNHQSIKEQMVGAVVKTFQDHGVRVNSLRASGFYKNDGTPCTISYPCDTDSYCVSSYP